MMSSPRSGLRIILKVESAETSKILTKCKTRNKNTLLMLDFISIYDSILSKDEEVSKNPAMVSL